MKRPIPFGKYYLLERINVGGMAEVFKAKAFGVEGFERIVAVKRILPNIAEDAEFISMFIDEAKIAVQLNHANIGQVFDLGKVEDSFFIAMEYVHGKDVRAIFDRCRTQAMGPMPIAQATFITMKVCEGLDYAHNKRDSSGKELHLVHRDVSPQNILVSYEGEVKIIDFGIAKAANKATKTQAGILKGKFGYMSPEQVRGIGLDRRSDIFSAGIILYELLTGERLFLGESDFSTLEKVRNVEILPPSTYNRKIPEELERIVLKTLSKDADDRYQNAIDLHDELQAFLYAAGEFFSRKDLTSWMKKIFAREIDDETRKLEEFHKVTPPPRDTPADGSPAAVSHAGRALRTPSWTEDEGETQVMNRASHGAGGDPASPLPETISPIYEEDATSAGPPPAPARRWPMVVGVLGVMFVAGGSASWWWTHRPGTLHIASDPANVRVYIDDLLQSALGTPTTLSLTPGDHVIRLEHADYQASTRPIHVAAASVERIVVQLDRLQGAGFLIYTDPPGATVVLDDQELAGKTPMRVSMVTVGQHALAIKKEGFQPYQRMADAKRTEAVRIDIKLVPAVVTARIYSQPSGAKVYLGFGGSRQFVGETPVTLRDLDVTKDYVVTLEQDGCETWSQPLRLTGSAPVIEAALACKIPAPNRVTPRRPELREPQTPPKPSRATANAIGYLKINCKPWAKLIIDGKDTGLTTPQLKIPLPVGRHKLTLVNPSFGVQKAVNVDIVDGETSVVLEDLRNP